MADDMEYESKPKIKEFHNEITQKEFTNENYKKLYDRVMSNENIIGAQIENIHYSLKMNNQTYKSYVESKDFKDAFEENIVPVEVYRLLVERVKMMGEIYSWKWLECEIYKNVSKKMKELHDETDAMEIRSEAMKEMKAMVERSNEVFLQQHKLNTNSYWNSINLMLEKNEMLMGKLLNNQKMVLKDILSEMVDFFNKMAPDKKEVIDRMKGRFDTTIDNLDVDLMSRQQERSSSEEEKSEVKEDAQDLDDPEKYVDKQKKSSLDYMKESDYLEKEEKEVKKRGPGRPPKKKDEDEDKQSINEDIFDDFNDSDDNPLVR